MARGLRLALLAIAALCAMRVGAYADEFRIRLDKVDQLALGGIYIYVPDANNNVCKLDVDKIETSEKFILNSAQIPFRTREEVWKLSETPLPENLDEMLKETERREHEWSFPLLTISGNVLPTKSGCIYSVEIEISEQVKRTTLKYSGKPFDNYVRIWRYSGLGISPASGITDAVSSAIETGLKEFVNERAEDIRNATKVQ